MIKAIETIEMPTWLKANDFQFNLKNILRNSLYYPSAGIDGTPIKYFMGNIYSFVYVDYGISKTKFNTFHKDECFRDYKRLFKIDVSEERFVYDIDLDYKKQDYYNKVEEDRKKNRRDGHYQRKPYCCWAVFERDKGLPAKHNPKRFSLLYLYSEAVSAYEVLYAKNKTAPKILCFIQPGSGFGFGSHSWTDYRDRKGAMVRKVLSRENWPKYLINGGYCDIDKYMDPIWPAYNKMILQMPKPSDERKHDDSRSFTLWARVPI